MAVDRAHHGGCLYEGLGVIETEINAKTKHCSAKCEKKVKVNNG